MKFLAHFVVTSFGLLALGVTSLHANTVFDFDERGNISVSLGGGPFLALPSGALETDPTLGVSGDVLVYNLTSVLTGFSLPFGDVPIANSSNAIVGDLRFTDPAGSVSSSGICGGVSCLMIFYVFDNNGLAADVGNISTSFLTTQTPGATLTGMSFSYTAGSITYDGTIVPEPDQILTLLAMISAMALIHTFRRRRRA